MSSLESQNIPIVGSLMQDVSIPLDSSQQRLVALWAVKTAMVVESVTRGTRDLAYTRTECERLRSASAIPERTSVWIGRYFGSQLGINGTDFWIDISEKVRRIGHGWVTTIVVGHLAIQVVTIHMLPE